MSLFDDAKAPGRDSSGSGPFSGLNLAPPAIDPSGKRKSIFEPSTSQSQPQSQSGMFSALGLNPSSSGPSPLAGAAATAAATPSPFSFGMPAATTSPSFGMGSTTATSGLSGGTFGAATSASLGGLFGTAPTTSAPTSSFFGSNTTTGQRTASSTFGTTTNQPNASASFIGNAGQQLETEPSQSRDPAHFNSLLERQKKKAKLLPHEQGGRLSQLPSLNMDLGDLARRAQDIGGRGLKAESLAADSRAHYILAGSGVSPGKAYREFQAMDGSDSLPDAGLPTPEYLTQSSTYLKDLQTKGREEMMRDSMDRVYREVDLFIEETLGIDFEEQQQRIMEHFGLVPKGDDVDNEGSLSPGNTGGFGKSVKRGHGRSADSSSGPTRSIFGRSAMEKSMIGTPGSFSGTASYFKGDSAGVAPGGLLRGQTARDLRDKERIFVEEVESLNLARLRGNTYQIMQKFGEAEKKAGGDTPKQLIDAYDALREITREQATSSGIKERQYANAYLNENDSHQNAQLRRQILDGSRSYLEKSCFQEIETLVEKNPREAQLGGRPSVINKIRAYIRVRAARRDLAPDGAELQRIGESGDFCWIMIFYLLRCGFVKDAAEYVNNDAAFQSTDRRFVSYMTTYSNSSDRRLSRKLQEMIDGEYQQRAKNAPKNSVDPYRMACYKIIGRCDLGSRNLESVGQGVEDWLWLQFALARELERLEELSGEAFGLDQICETITEIGQKHFQKGQIENSNAYGTFFLMQLLAGMFEQAVDYLHGFNPVSAVHFATALAYYGLLRVSDFSVAGNELLTQSTTGQSLLNFVPLIAYYTTTFRTALPVAAVDYLSLICLNGDLSPPSIAQAQIKACHECLRELCLETREFAKLLGDIRSDGSRIPGAIEQRAPLILLETHEDFLRAITNQSAAIADQRGQVADAVLLYHLCEDYDSVVSILNRALGEAITLDLGESPMQLQPLKPRRETEKKSASDKGGPASSLSLTQSTSSPVELAKNMISLYDGDAAYYNSISSTNRDTCGALLRLLSVRSHLEAQPPRYMNALEELNDLNILPLMAGGSVATIRAAASAFGALPQLIARCAGISVVWAVSAIGGERDNMMQRGSWDTGYGSDKDAMKAQLASMAKDLMVFAGLVKYKLPGRVYDMLTRAGGDVGGY